ncbi:MAG TPA: YhdP family protein [Burkholderiales bacterium]|nr:YhdP family protein [Burkholderiales bacterium]
MDQPFQKLEQAIEETIEHAIAPKSRWRTVARLIGWGLFVVYLLFAAAVVCLRYWVLPKVGEYRSDIEQYASKSLGQRITIGAIEAGWRGLRPDLFLADVTIYDHDGRAALTLPGVEATVSWISALIGSPRFYSLVFDRPRLEIRRDAAGKFYVAGIELHPARREDAGIAQWVLSQREIAIHDASVSWSDELRGAPLLALPALDFVLRNGLLGHRFALRAKPPPELASALDVRGELHGSDVGDLLAWTGRVYAELEYTDLVAWRRWVDYPLEIRSGKGGVRLWLSIADDGLAEATADVALSQVVTRVAKDLPLLELDYLQGRLGGKQNAADNAFEVSGRKIALKTGAGVVLPPADFRVRWQAGDGRQNGDLEVNTLELAPLAKLTEYLPFPRQARARLAATEPRGSLSTLKVAWTGEAENPQHYSVRGVFSKLAARANEGIPGFAGLTGRLEASEKGGSVVLGSQQVAIELPGIVAESPVRLDRLSAQISWKLSPGELYLGFNNLSLANRDIAGTLFGNFSARQGSRGVIDLTGIFSRADGRAVYRYIPWLPERVVEYLKASIQGGQSNDVRLRLKGDLAKFPFEEPGSGIFQIVAKVTGADFRYAEGWPRASGISGDLIFEGRSMRVAASRAAVLGVQASNVSADIPDLFHGNVQLGIEIRAEDQTDDFLRFIAQSPVTRALDGITESTRATGAGRLALQLDIPIPNTAGFKVAGSYQIVDNEFRADSDAPPFSHVNGQIEFTESGVTARTLTAQFLGGPATISVATRADGTIAVNAHGTASAAQLPRSWGEALLRQVSGAAAWQGTLAGARGQPVTLVVQSQLTGISADLPPPLGKRAFEPMPLKIERVIGAAPPRSDTIKVSLGPSVNAHIQRRREGARYVVERGVISLNEPAVLPDRDGVFVTGSLPYVDVDRWRSLLGSKDETGSSFSPSLDLKVAALDFGGRRLNEVALRAGTSGAVWIANVAAKELEGEIAWRPEGFGRIIARLKHFSMPEATPGRGEEAPLRDLPALDIVADKLIRNNADLGRLELVAVNKALDWTIEKLVLTGPESTLSASGVWQSWALQPTVAVKFELEVNDIGRYLDRVGYPRTMRRGSAKLKGNLSWAGSPQSIDYSTLTGHLDFSAGAGQFLKAEPGAARLIGVLSMQSWITLDFRELFNRGFAFDSVSCDADVANGVLTTQNFRMRGPSAQVSMEGQVDLARETQDLHARVEPSVGDSVSAIVAVIVNPVWGLGSLIVQKILRNPLGQAFAFEYRVTGTWTEPHPERLKADIRSAGATQQSPP